MYTKETHKRQTINYKGTKIHFISFFLNKNICMLPVAILILILFMVSRSEIN